MRALCLLMWAGASVWLLAPHAALPAEAGNGAKFYTVVDGRADQRTMNGYRRYHAGCNHCHGPNGEGSTFATSLVDPLPPLDVFMLSVLDGKTNGNLVMNGFRNDPNFAPYLLDIYAYLQARADGALGRGRPPALQP
jgi:mono/diheme cytochrome c family protein